jgi:hypothetical protein
LDYVCKKIRYWLYSTKQRARADRYLARLQRVLKSLPENDSAIIREEGLALVGELKGDLGAVITHREREIRLMERLHQEAQSPTYEKSTRDYMLQDRGRVALENRRAILETLRKAKAQSGFSNGSK